MDSMIYLNRNGKMVIMWSFKWNAAFQLEGVASGDSLHGNETVSSCRTKTKTRIKTNFG